MKLAVVYERQKDIVSFQAVNLAPGWLDWWRRLDKLIHVRNAAGRAASDSKIEGRLSWRQEL
jgi:hypothetical protein